MAGPDLMLSARTGLAMGMVMHELATNAAKYGGLSTPGGHVDVTWSLDGEGDGARLSLQWRESGGPPVTKPNRRGFGSRLIEHSIGNDLSGEIELSHLPSGFQCRLAFPLITERT
jgi:two-component sensor histidine kinase